MYVYVYIVSNIAFLCCIYWSYIELILHVRNWIYNDVKNGWKLINMTEFTLMR